MPPIHKMNGEAKNHDRNSSYFFNLLTSFCGISRPSVQRPRLIRLVWVVGEKYLMIIFSRPKFVEWRDLGNDRVGVDTLGVDLVDDLFGNAFLFLGMIKDRRPVR